jgi:hypothetical protein
MQVPYRLPKNFRDRAQLHLATWSPILNPYFVNNTIPTPSTEAMESRFVLWPFNKPTPLPATSSPLCIHTLVFYANASNLTYYFFAACVGCQLLLTLFLAHRSLSPWWWRRYDPPKRRLLQEPRGVTSQKTPFLLVMQFVASIPTQTISFLPPYFTKSFFALKVKRDFSSETSVYFQRSTRRHIPEDSTLQLRSESKRMNLPLCSINEAPFNEDIRGTGSIKVPFLTSALVGCKSSDLHLNHFNPREIPFAD